MVANKKLGSSISSIRNLNGFESLFDHCFRNYFKVYFKFEMFQMLPITNVGLLPFTVNRKGFGGFVPLLVALARSVEHDFLENRSKVELDKPATNTFP